MPTNIWTDGSYIDGISGWAYCVDRDGKKYSRSGAYHELARWGSIAAEYTAVKNSLLEVKDDAVVHCDVICICDWLEVAAGTSQMKVSKTYLHLLAELMELVRGRAVQVKCLSRKHMKSGDRPVPYKKCHKLARRALDEFVATNSLTT